MGILVEFNPDLALRNIREHKEGRRRKEECIPEPLEAGKEYSFLKTGQRNYWLEGEIPLLETEGDGKLSLPKASIRILETRHMCEGNDTYTRGRYRVIELIEEGDIRFNGFAKMN